MERAPPPIPLPRSDCRRPKREARFSQSGSVPSLARCPQYGRPPHFTDRALQSSPALAYKSKLLAFPSPAKYTTMSYNVFLVEYLGAPRNHHALFVETDPESGAGLLLHVTGNIQDGMTFEERETKKPEESNTFSGKKSLGWVAIADLDRMRDICASNPPPKKQFDRAKRLYPNEPLRRCQEWTAETVASLTGEGVIQPHHSLAGVPEEDEYWVWSEQYGNWYHVHEDGTYEWAEGGESSSSQPNKSKQGKKDKGKRKG
ncbi:hypothetical protein RB600_001486 [Gaeumannomyces tritici]